MFSRKGFLFVITLQLCVRIPQVYFESSREPEGPGIVWGTPASCLCSWCSLLFENILINFCTLVPGERGSVVGWVTMLQAGRSRFQFPMMSLDFSIDLIFPAALILTKSPVYNISEQTA
jgi:hypothetical protein